MARWSDIRRPFADGSGGTAQIVARAGRDLRRWASADCPTRSPVAAVAGRDRTGAGSPPARGADQPVAGRRRSCSVVSCAPSAAIRRGRGRRPSGTSARWSTTRGGSVSSGSPGALISTAGVQVEDRAARQGVQPDPGEHQRLGAGGRVGGGDHVGTVDDGDHPAAPDLQPAVRTDHRRGVLVDADAELAGVGRDQGQQPAEPIALGEVLIDDHARRAGPRPWETWPTRNFGVAPPLPNDTMNCEQMLAPGRRAGDQRAAPVGAPGWRRPAGCRPPRWPAWSDCRRS